MTIEFWYLIGAALVFWMQAGFAMVETGFTRAKNAGNIIMKNLMDFCIGTVVFSLLGYTLMMGEDALFGLIGLPNMDLFSNFKAFIASPADGFTGASTFVFNLVFCATAATIVSGAMAERTKFSAYCIYSAIISLVVYPIEAHWIWGGGWLSQIGFHDYAGSCAIHMVGGIAALIGAIFLGPRIGKYVKDASGKVVKVNAIPGHSIPLGALGVFILWLGWYGFNGAAAQTPGELASVFLTTTIAPSVATCTTLLYTWFKNGKPDVSMCLNASLAGLVGVTAGCDAFDILGSAVVGIVSGRRTGHQAPHRRSGRCRRRSYGKRHLGHDCRRTSCQSRRSRRLTGAFLYRLLPAARYSVARCIDGRRVCHGHDDPQLYRDQENLRSACGCCG